MTAGVSGTEAFSVGICSVRCACIRVCLVGVKGTGLKKHRGARPACLVLGRGAQHLERTDGRRLCVVSVSYLAALLSCSFPRRYKDAPSLTHVGTETDCVHICLYACGLSSAVSKKGGCMGCVLPYVTAIRSPMISTLARMTSLLLPPKTLRKQNRRREADIFAL